MGRIQLLSIPERLDAYADITGQDVVMGFVDVGFYPHPDLMRPDRRIRAYADATREVPDGNEFFSPQPYGWHGTMTACAAAGNGYRSGGSYRGIASEADVVLIKAGTDGGRVRGHNVAHAIRFPLRFPNLKIKIVNISLGVDPDDPHFNDVEQAVEEVVAAGVTVFAAAGNVPGQKVSAPGSSPRAITVGGQHDRFSPDVDGEKDRHWPSSFGSHREGVQKPDLLAPAIWVPAPMLPGTLTAREAQPLFQLLSVLEELSAEHGFSERNQLSTAEERAQIGELMRVIVARIRKQKYISPDYQHVDGTSFAAPIAASVAAQMLEVAPRLTPDDIREGLCSTAERLADVADHIQGAGVLRPRAAVDWARVWARRQPTRGRE
ncbi:MAG: S8 family serine peptidase [Polyangiaceae bacterium]|nr:S8 family serine peptidase [Polyangiaceae bacterium]